MATNIITARFGGALSTRTASKYQYDYGQVLKFADIDLPDVYEVHFSNLEFFGSTVTQLGNADGVLIPDELFWSDTARAIYAWVYLHHAEDDGETVYKVTIPLAQRSRPSDVEPTPVQQDVIEQAIAALQSATAETTASAAEAAASAGQAAGSAAEAQTARDAAVAAAESVEQYATRAETAAGQAEDAAGRAAATAETVESRVSDAETAATQAAGSATTASGAASQAAQKAGEASTYASNAAASASQAQTYASNAGESATAASGSASAAADSATAAAGYAGAASGSATAAERSADNAAGSATDAAASADAAAESAEEAAQAVQEMRTTTAAIIIDSASGDVVSVPDGADDLSMKSVKVMIEPVQDLHGYGKPWAAGAGKNLLEIKRTETYTQRGITYVVNRDSNGVPVSVTCTGTSTENGSFYNLNYTAGVLSIPKGTAFKVSGGKDGVVVQACLPTASASARSQDGNASSSFTVSENAESSWVRVGVTEAGTTVNTTIYPMLVLATETDFSFAPYENICPISGHDAVTVTVNGSTYTTDLPVTVYGGTLDVVSGELVIDRGYIASYNGETIGEPWISDRDAYTAGATPTTGAQVVYTLATPTTYHLTPQEIKTLLGNNTVWSEAGSVEIVYPCDTKLYILKVVS